MSGLDYESFIVEYIDYIPRLQFLTCKQCLVCVLTSSSTFVSLSICTIRTSRKRVACVVLMPSRCQNILDHFSKPSVHPGLSVQHLSPAVLEARLVATFKPLHGTFRAADIDELQRLYNEGPVPPMTQLKPPMLYYFINLPHGTKVTIEDIMHRVAKPGCPTPMIGVGGKDKHCFGKFRCVSTAPSRDVNSS
jgi:hypothetical protein